MTSEVIHLNQKRTADSDREQFTIRVPRGLLGRVREEAASYGDSMNELVVAAVEKEVSMRAQLRLLDQIEQERLQLEKRGLQPDSTPIIRQLRTREDRHG